MEHTENVYRDATLHAVQLFTRPGFAIHSAKSVFHPTQLFLGFQLISTSMTERLTKNEANNVVDMCLNDRHGQGFTIREVASMIGTLITTVPRMEFGLLYYRNLEHDKDVFGNYEEKMSLSRESYEELEWWVSAITTTVRKIDHGCPTVTDASQIGLDATTLGNKIQGLWLEQESGYHINILELRAVELGLISLLHSITGCHR